MKLYYINNFGGGFADTIDVTEGLMVQQFFRERMPHCRPEDYLIRVNRLPVSADQVLQAGPHPGQVLAGLAALADRAGGGPGGVGEAVDRVDDVGGPTGAVPRMAE